MTRRSFALRDFECSICGAKMSFPKKPNRKTANGHIKHAYCYRCKKVTPFEQVSILQTKQ